MARVIWKADQLGMIVTIAPTIWGRLGKLWQKYTFAAKLPARRVFQQVRDYFFFQLRQWIDIRSVQQNIYSMYGYKLSIARLKWWIIRRRIGQEPS